MNPQAIMMALSMLEPQVKNAQSTNSNTGINGGLLGMLKGKGLEPIKKPNSNISNDLITYFIIALILSAFTFFLYKMVKRI